MRIDFAARMARNSCLLILIMGVTLAVSTGCGGPAAGGQGPITGVNPDGTPRWVNKGSGAFEGKYGRAFYGVGVLSGVRNKGLARQAVDNRARAEIAKIFDTYIAAMMKDYQRSTTAGDFKASAEEQDIVSAQKTITEVTLRGVEVRDHWTDPRDGTMYALAMLDVNNVNRNLDSAQGLNKRVRDYVRANARRAFNDLDQELHKRKSPAPAEPRPGPRAPEPRAEPPRAEPREPPPGAPQPRAEPAPAAKPPGQVRVGLRITGTKASIIQTCFANRITTSGYKLFENTSDVDVMVRGKLKYQKAGNIGGSVMVRASAEVRVSNMENGQTSAAVVEQIKVGRPTLRTAVQLAITRLCNRIVPKIMDQIRGAIRR